MTSSRLRPAVALLLCVFLLGACGFSTDGSDDSNEPSTPGPTLYSGRIPAAIGGAVDMYEAQADRDVQVRYGETGDLAATLIEEGDNSPADVFFAQEPGAIGAVENAGLLAKLPAGHPRPGAGRSTATRAAAGSGSPAAPG